jgi:hypothetical protein
MTVSLQAAPKVSPARFDIHPYRLDNWHQRIVELRTRPRRTGAHTSVSTCVQIRSSTSRKSSKICGHLSSMFLSKGLTCYTDVESNGRDASYQNQTGCQMCDLERETRMHAQMTVSAPCSQKVSPARFDIHPYRLTRIKGSSNFSRGDQVHNTTHTGFNVRARFGLQQAKLLKICGHLLMFLSKV